MVLRVVHNPYPGINAHLNSLLQTPGTIEQPALWHTFHTRHITHLCDFLNEQLPEGYIAFAEQSLQSRTADNSGMIRLRKPEPDVSIFQHSMSPSSSPGRTVAAPVCEAA